MKPNFVLLFLVTTLNYFCTGIDDENFVIDIETEPIIPPPLIPDDPDLVAWTPFKSCPAGSVVTGFKFDSSRLTPDDGTSASLEAIQGVAFQCSMLNRWSHFVPVKVISEGELDSQSHWTYLTHQNYAVGLGWGEWTSLDGSNSLMTGSWLLKFDKEKWTIGFPLGSSNGIRREMNCPESHAICGFSAQRSLQLDIITRFRFKCCYQCDPIQTFVVVFDFTNNGITDVTHTVTKRIGMTRSQLYSEGRVKEKKHNFNPGVSVDPSFTGNRMTTGGLTNVFNLPNPPPLPNGPGGGSRNGGGRSRRQIGLLEKFARQGDGKPDEMAKPSGPKPSPDEKPGSVGGSPSAPEPPAPPTGPKPPKPGSGNAHTTMSGTNANGVFSLKAKFEAKYGITKSLGFNWGSTSWQNWREDLEETDTLTCKALHRCVLKQLVGKCGIHQFNTPNFDFNHIPLRPGPLTGDLANNLLQTGPFPSPPPDPMDMKAMHPGQSWILVKFLSFFRRSGVWGPMKNCPPGTIVTGHQVRSKFRSPFTGLNLICSKLNASEMYEGVSVMATGEGEPMSSFMEKQKPAVGVAFADFRMNGTVVKQNLEFRFDDEDNFLPLPMGARNINRTVAMCPPGYAICGMQMMMDGRGVQVTDASFRCCYHCNPEEKIVVLESFTNLGYTDSIQTVTRTVGAELTNEHNQGHQNDTGNERDVMGINPVGLQAGFAARFDQKNSLGFNWGQTSNSFWNNQEEKTLTLLCKARHLCTFRQLIGTCGQFEIPTPYTIKESFPLDGDSGPPSGGSIFQNFGNNNNSVILSKFGVLDGSQKKEGIMTMPRIRRGETWVMAQNLTFSKNDRKQVDEEEDQWENSKICPPGTFVTAQRLKSDPVGFKFSGLSVKCSRGQNDDGGGDGFEHVMELTSGDGIKQTNWYEARSPAIGFTWVQYDLNGTKWKSGWEFRFLKDVPYHRVPKGAKNISRTETECPPGYAVCGYQALFDKGMGSRGQLTNLLLKCCYYCIPREKFIVLNAFTNIGTVDTTETMKLVIGSSSSKQENVGDNKMSDIIDRTDMQRAFVNQFLNRSSSSTTVNKSKMKNFNWNQMSPSLFLKEEKKKMVITCRARHACKFRQLIGTCNGFEVRTPHTMHKIIPLPSSTNEEEELNSKMDEGKFKTIKGKKPSKTKRMDEKFVMNETNEIWIVAENLTTAQKSGRWDDPQICPLASVVTAFHLNHNANYRLGGIGLRCSRLNSTTGQFETSPNATTTATTAELISGGGFEDKKIYSWRTSQNNPAIGFSFIDLEVFGGVTSYFWRAGWTLKFEGEDMSKLNSNIPPPRSVTNVTRIIAKYGVTCPSGHVVCGMRTMFDKGNENILTNLALKCCHFCRPEERLVTLDSFRNLGHSKTTQNVKWTVGTRVEKEGREGSFVSASEIRSAFTHGLSKSTPHSPHFNWLEAPASLFTRREMKQTSYSCEPGHKCAFKQLMGFCNEIQIPSPYTIIEMVPV